MRLTDFILANIEPILADWEAFARSLAPGATMEKLALRDDAEEILLATVRNMGAAQTLAQQSSKSKGHGGADGAESDQLNHASDVHGVGRVGSGFDLMEVVSEYRALRASVLRLWRESSPASDLHDLDDLTRFNEAMDQSLGKSVQSYSNRVDQSRRMFLAILGHDLRNPLNTIMLSAQLVAQTHKDHSESFQAMSQIETSAAVIGRLVNDLLDFASTALGAAMPLKPGPVDLGKLCREVFDECQAAYPTRLMHHDCGDVIGEWDAARLRQVMSNLLGNALQHGSASAPVELSVSGEGPQVTIAVRNQGPPIPPTLLPIIFDPLVRGSSPDALRRAGSVGLGLYIAREIVLAHGGTIDVQSSPQSGTVFTVRLPRQPARK